MGSSAHPSPAGPSPVRRREDLVRKPMRRAIRVPRARRGSLPRTRALSGTRLAFARARASSSIRRGACRADVVHRPANRAVAFSSRSRATVSIASAAARAPQRASIGPALRRSPNRSPVPRPRGAWRPRKPGGADAARSRSAGAAVTRGPTSERASPVSRSRSSSWLRRSVLGRGTAFGRDMYPQRARRRGLAPACQLARLGVHAHAHCGAARSPRASDR